MGAPAKRGRTRKVKLEPKNEQGRAGRRDLRNRFEKLMEEVRSSRVHFRNVVERNADGIIIVNAEGAIMYMNPAAELLFGRDREEIIGRSFGVPEDSDEPVEIDFQLPDGTVGAGEMRTVPTDWEGERALLISVRDITQRKRAENEIRNLAEKLEERVHKRTEQLEALNRELEAFNYAVSHDLRAPLARIDGYATLLLDDLVGKINPEQDNYLKRIRAAVANMVELTEGLLQLSRLTRRKMEIQEVDLSGAAQLIVDNLRQQEPDRQVQVTVAPGMTARGDLVLVKAVLENLLGNAWKFTRKRERAEIEVGVKQTNGERVFFVRDNGAGFDMAQAGELFGAFQRLHDQSEFPGTGVGLTTVQRIVHRHGGRIWAEAEVDRGATFYFTLGE